MLTTLMEMGLSKLIKVLLLPLIVLIVVSMAVDWNHQGYRQIVQTGVGNVKCVFSYGPYWTGFGTSIPFNDVITFDFDKDENSISSGSSVEQVGIPVRYRDGGLGTIYGLVRFNLPDECEDMKKLAKEFKSNEGLALKLLKPTTEEVANQTAGLMTSEESYAEKRSIFSGWFEDQLERGRFHTKIEEIVTTEAGFEHCLDKSLLTEEQFDECAKVRRTRERIPVIDEARTDRVTNPLKQYGIVISGAPLKSPDYETSTLEQISKKRDATMGIITARANAERSKADAIAAEQAGKEAVVKAQYLKETEKAQAIVEAEKIQAVAVIAAEQKVEVAKQVALEAEQKAKAAEFYKIEQIKIGEGDAERKRLVMEADGALEQKLATYKAVMTTGFIELGKQKWVPEVQMNSTGGQSTGSSNVAAMIDMLSAKTAKDLSLDISTNKK